jgi:hypothetical protein
MKNGSVFALLISTFLFSFAAAQDCPTCPPGYYCPPAEMQVAEETALNWYQRLTYATGITQTPELEAEARRYSERAIRITTGNSCGSGSLVGRTSDAILILTNAHVATNRMGHMVNCEARLKGGNGVERFSAVVIEGAYSSRDTTDWSLLKADPKHLAGFEPIKLSIRRPDHKRPSFTWGCPRCEVPSGQVLKTVVGEGLVWKWLPNSIGGQSGSSVFQRGYAHGLLTWSYSAPGGSVGAGQYTAEIYRQSRNQTSDSAPRPDGLVPVCQYPQADLIEGYACADPAVRLATIAQTEDPFIASGYCLDGFVRQSGVNDLPIWGDPDSPTGPIDPPTDPPTDPTPPACPPLSSENRKKLEDAKKLIDEVLNSK